jgi:hypothetical protein
VVSPNRQRPIRARFAWPRVPDILRNRSLDWFAHNFFRPRKCAAAMSCDVSASSLQPLSRQSAGTVHEFYDMDEMPISQWFLEFIAERSLSLSLSCDDASNNVVASRGRDVPRCGRRERIHVSLIRKLFFLFCCSNRNAVPTIRVGTDATPPAQLD